jgi:hypothetical protein
VITSVYLLALFFPILSCLSYLRRIAPTGLCILLILYLNAYTISNFFLKSLSIASSSLSSDEYNLFLSACLVFSVGSFLFSFPLFSVIRLIAHPLISLYSRVLIVFLRIRLFPPSVPVLLFSAISSLCLLVLILASPAHTLWITNPRIAYMTGRAGLGFIWIPLVGFACLSIASTNISLLRRSIVNIFGTFLSFILLYLSGSKGSIATGVLVLLLNFNFNFKHIRFSGLSPARLLRSFSQIKSPRILLYSASFFLLFLLYVSKSLSISIYQYAAESSVFSLQLEKYFSGGFTGFAPFSLFLNQLLSIPIKLSATVGLLANYQTPFDQYYTLLIGEKIYSDGNTPNLDLVALGLTDSSILLSGPFVQGAFFAVSKVLPAYFIVQLCSRLSTVLPQLKLSYISLLSILSVFPFLGSSFNIALLCLLL